MMSERIAVTDLGPDDVIILQAAGYLDLDQRKWITKHVAEVFPDHKCLILDGGLTLSVVSPEADDTPHMAAARAKRWVDLFNQGDKVTA